MMEQRSGSIVTIASIEGMEGCEGGSTYNAPKGGVILLTKTLRTIMEGLEYEPTLYALVLSAPNV